MVFFRIFLALTLSMVHMSCGGDDDKSSSDAAQTDDATTSDGGTLTDGGGGVLPFMSECDLANDNCDEANGDMCFDFSSKGPHCTHACDGTEDCPSPSPGCNNMGVCKAP